MLLRIISISFSILIATVASGQLADFSKLSSSLDRLTDIKIDSTINVKTSNTILSKTNYNTFYQRHLGAMCKIENNINKATVFPVTMRLGSVQYVDRLEGKVEEYTPIKK